MCKYIITDNNSTMYSIEGKDLYKFSHESLFSNPYNVIVCIDMYKFEINIV